MASSLCRTSPAITLWAVVLVALLSPMVGHAGLAGVDVPGSKRLTVSDWGGARCRKNERLNF